MSLLDTVRESVRNAAENSPVTITWSDKHLAEDMATWDGEVEKWVFRGDDEKDLRRMAALTAAIRKVRREGHERQ